MWFPHGEEFRHNRDSLQTGVATLDSAFNRHSMHTQDQDGCMLRNHQHETWLPIRSGVGQATRWRDMHTLGNAWQSNDLRLVLPACLRLVLISTIKSVPRLDSSRVRSLPYSPHINSPDSPPSKNDGCSRKRLVI